MIWHFIYYVCTMQYYAPPCPYGCMHSGIWQLWYYSRNDMVILRPFLDFLLVFIAWGGRMMKSWIKIPLRYSIIFISEGKSFQRLSFCSVRPSHTFIIKEPLIAYFFQIFEMMKFKKNQNYVIRNLKISFIFKKENNTSWKFHFMKRYYARLGIEPQTCKITSFESWCLSPLNH